MTITTPSHQAAARRPGRRRSGNALLDMALVMPLLIGLTFGAVEYGYAMYIKHSLQSAAREGARAAIVSGATVSSVQQAVDDSMAAAGFPTDKYTRPVQIEPGDWRTAAAGQTIKVTVQTTWGTAGVNALPTYLGGIGPSKTLSGATTMRKEG